MKGFLSTWTGLLIPRLMKSFYQLFDIGETPLLDVEIPGVGFTELTEIFMHVSRNMIS